MIDFSFIALKTSSPVPVIICLLNAAIWKCGMLCLNQLKRPMNYFMSYMDAGNSRDLKIVSYCDMLSFHLH